MSNQYLEYMLYDSDSDPIGLPDGVLFLSEKETLKMESAAGQLMSLFQENKYRIVTPPIFEYYEIFEKGGGPEIARKTFSFKDKEGKLLSLRYDMTTPIARMTSMKYSQKELPLKFCYCGDVFREQPRRGVGGLLAFAAEHRLVGMRGEPVEIVEQPRRRGRLGVPAELAVERAEGQRVELLFLINGI